MTNTPAYAVNLVALGLYLDISSTYAVASTNGINQSHQPEPFKLVSIPFAVNTLAQHSPRTLNLSLAIHGQDVIGLVLHVCESFIWRTVPLLKLCAPADEHFILSELEHHF